MKLEFNQKDIEAMMLEKAMSLGIKANTAEIEIEYHEIKRAVVFYEEIFTPAAAPA
jgi:hypothetical protein